MNEFDYLTKAKIKLKDENYNEAIELCNEALKINKELHSAYSIRGDAYYYLERYSDAFNDQTKAIAIQPDNSEYYYDRSLTNDCLNNLEDALVDITAAISIEPKNSLYYGTKAYLEYQMARYKEAIYNFSKAINIKAKDDDYIYRAKCYKFFENYDLAFKDYSTAIEANPETSNAYFERGVLYRELGNYTKAIEDFERASEIIPFDDKPYFEIGKCKAEMGEMSSTMKYFDKAIKINPCTEYYRKKVIMREVILNMHKNVINMHKNKPVKDIGGKNIMKIFNKKQAREDIKDLTKVIEQESDDTIALLMKAQRHVYLKEYSKALDDYNCLIGLEPENKKYYRERADVKYQLNMLEEAIEDYDKFFELENKN